MLYRVDRNGAWLAALPHCLNEIDMSRKEFQNKLHIRYGMMLLNITESCDVFSKKFMVNHDLQCPCRGLVL